MTELADRFTPLWLGRRGDEPDVVRWGAFAVAGADGRLLAAGGDPRLPAFLRSSAKPFQAVSFLRRRLDAALGVSEAEIACACASHSGQDEHVAAARAVLEAAGVPVSALRCTGRQPIGASVRIAIARGEAVQSALHDNCSGKHAAMLATCAHEGWPFETYADREHPLQRENLETFAAFAGVPSASVRVAVDDCTVPAFAVPLAAAARAMARLHEPSGLPEDLAEAGRRAAAAMVARPEMVGGDGRLDTNVMRVTGGRLLSKAGANGYQAIAAAPVNGRPALGFVLKLAGAEPEATKAPTCIALLEAVGLLDPDEAEELRALHVKPPTSCSGEVVGDEELIARWRRY